MATEKEIDGKVWILKDDVESIVRNRVSKVAERANQWESKAKEYEAKVSQIQDKVATADTLAARVQELEGKLQNATGAFSRFKAATQLGIQDTDTIEALEWAHSRAMSGRPKKDQVGFDEWLGGLKSKPDDAPSFLRHIFQQNQQPETSTQPQPERPFGVQRPQAPQVPEQQPQTQQASQPPAQQTPWQPSMQGQQHVPPNQGGVSPETIRGATDMNQWMALYQQSRGRK